MNAGALIGFFTIGALLFNAGGCSRMPSAPSTPTFNKDVAPIVFSNCASCHRPGEAAPFSLLTYNDVKTHASSIADVTRRRYMPPWLPEHGEFPILGERRLTDAQIDIIQRWVSGGLIEGSPADLPPLPEWPDGWQLGRPDVVVTPARPYLLSPRKDETYRDLVVPTSLESDVFVRAVEFKTGGAPIHHAVIRVDRTSASRRRDGQDGQPGFDSTMAQSIQDPDGQFIGWAPGSGPILSPAGMPWRLPRGSDLVIEVHLVSASEPLSIQPTVGLFLTDTPSTRNPVRVRMGSKLIDIPAGEPNYVVTDTYELPVDVDLLSVFPHAHYLGKDMLFTAALPGGPAKPLLHIKQWNFRWQQDYRYATPIPLPRGTILTMRYTYDNSERNTENPNRPPVRVRAGERSTDEMATFGMQVMTKSQEDSVRLVQEFDERDLMANVAMAEARVREEPNVAGYRSLLGGTYVEVGRFADALPHLREAIRLKDESAGTYNYLGMALQELGSVAESLRYFERAAALDPKNETAFFNLGNALARLSRSDEAVKAYERSLAINPDYAYAHVNLAVLLAPRGRTNDALAHLQRAAELEPDSAVMHLNLGNGLAGAGRFVEAMQHIRRALELEPNAAPALETFKRLQRLGIR